MEKWYKKCPFCWEEIKEIAKKCRFCWEFLEWENDSSSNEKKEEKITVNNYWFWGNFFRKDLSLNKKWWHRLVKGIFIMILIWIPCYFYVTDDDLRENIPYIFSYHEKMADLNSRFPDNNGFRNPLYLKKEWERIRNAFITNDTYEIISKEPRFTNWQDLLFESYCSPKLSKNFDSICEKTWIHSYWSLFGWYISLSQAKQEIDNYNITCLNIVHDHFVPEEYDIFYYRKTPGSILHWIWICLWDIFKYLLISIWVWVILVVIYYKVIIYSIYWNSNK